MMPMPGTEMWNYAVKSNIIDLKICTGRTLPFLHLTEIRGSRILMLGWNVEKE